MRGLSLLICIALLSCFSSAASAQSVGRAQVLAECPDYDKAEACPVITEQFLGSLPSGERSNQQIFDVAVAIADAVEPETVRLEVCLDAEEGVRVLAAGLKSDARMAELLARAADMCGGEIVTGSIGSLTGGDDDGGGGPIIDPGTPGGTCISPGSSSCNGNSESSDYNPTALKD